MVVSRRSSGTRQFCMYLLFHVTFMKEMTETTKQISDAVEYLAVLANSLPSSTPRNLKSYYLSKCRKLTLNSAVTLPQQFLKSTKRCARCCVDYKDTSSLYKIQPVRKKNRFIRRLVKRKANEEHLTLGQQKYVKRYFKNGSIEAYNRVVITCGLCAHEMKEKLKKPLTETGIPVNRTNKKRKKKKDRFSGLNIDAVLSVTPHKASAANTFVPFESTPIHKIQKAEPKKNLFTLNKRTNNQLDQKSNSKATNKKKQQQLKKGIQHILENSKQKQSPSVSLTQFLISL